MFGAGELSGCREWVPQTFADYLDGEYEAAFVCTDFSLFDPYCKDEGVLRGVMRAFIDSGICAAEDVKEITPENNGRTGFYW